MKSCANCALCYVDPTNGMRDTYRCLRGLREPIKELFVLGRITCDKYVEVNLKIDSKKGE